MIKTLRHEALDWLLIFGERHLQLVLQQYIEHYNQQRPHLALSLHLSPHPPLAPERWCASNASQLCERRRRRALAVRRTLCAPQVRNAETVVNILLQ